MKTALIVDDERLARVRLRALVAHCPDLRVVGEADSVASAAESVRRLLPDVVFLDVNLAGESGFDLLREEPGRYRTIFVTAYEQFAVRAFEVAAVDYLLKPIRRERLESCLARLSLPAEHLFLDGGRIVRSASITHIAAVGAYSEVHLDDGTRHIEWKTLKDWEKRLPESFRRIHRSTLVNLDFVARVDGSLVHLRGRDAPLVMSRRFARRLR